MTTITPAVPATESTATGATSPADPRWTRYALAGLLGLTAVLCLWDLGASGWANAFYSAAAQAGADNWTSFLFGSSDMANSITVDKPPASIWVMALSVKMFGLNSWSLLVPQALMGVGTVALMYAAVKRWYGVRAGLLAGLVLAMTPAAALMFRFNNPDALLVLLLVGAAYAVVRATETANWRWLALAGVLVGFAFLTKSLQAFLVLPAFVIVYLVAADTSPARRVRDLFIALAALIVAGGWWVALVELWPADSRPYIGGSQTNSAWELIMGYNGLGRITGNEAGSVVPGGGAGGPGGAGGSMWGETGWNRMFDGGWAGGIAWLLPTAFVLAVAGFWLTRRHPRISVERAGLILWSGWLVVTWATFSFASGIIHEYYAIALAPAIAALVAAGATLLWRRRDQMVWRGVMAAVIAATGLYATWLLTRAEGVYVAAGFVVAITSLITAALLLLPLDDRWQRRVGAAALVTLLVGPGLFTAQTVVTPHTGSLPTAGPTLAGSRSGAGGGPGGGPGGMMPGGTTNGGTTGFTPPTGGGPGAGGGGLLDASTPSTELVDTLTANASEYEWMAATVGSQNGAGYQLATGYSVMPIGGFNGSDPSPTLAEFQQLVREGRIHWFIAGGGMGPGGGPGGAGGSEITSWVEQNFTATTVDGTTLYDLSGSGSA